MPTPTKVQLTGGNFQDSEGNLLALGYLIMELSQDETISGVGNICSGLTIKILLDSSGSVVTSPAQYVWGNDVMMPVNSYYKVTGYSAAGQPCWGPNIQQVTGAGPFNVGTWVPNTVLSWIGATLQQAPILLEHGGTPNSSQQLLNLESTDSSVTITDEGGGTINLTVTIPAGVELQHNGVDNTSQILLDLVDTATVTWANTGGQMRATASAPPLPAGTNVIPLSIVSPAFPSGGTSIATVNTSGATNSIVQAIPGNSLLCIPAQWTVTFGTYSASTVIKAVLLQCTRGTGNVLSITPIKFGGSATPTLAPAGVYQSDTISLQLSTAYDYYLALNTSTGLFTIVDDGTGRGGVYVFPSDQTAASTLVFAGGNPEYGKNLTYYFQSA